MPDFAARISGMWDERRLALSVTGSRTASVSIVSIGITAFSHALAP
jgi:hypothetical protein